MRGIRKRTIVFTSAIMLSVMMAGMFFGGHVKAYESLSDGSESVEYQKSSLADYYGKKAPEHREGFLFAGWYLDSQCTAPYIQGQETESEQVWAKFVPTEVLGVKAQVQNVLFDRFLDDTDTGVIRFVTSVDSTNYKEAGLHITGTIGSVQLNQDYPITKVYNHLYAVNTNDQSNQKTADEVFGSAAKFFAPKNFKIRLDQFGDDFTITPYWITMDGLRVDGKTATKSMVHGLEYSSYAEVNQRAYYKSNDIFKIATAMNRTGTEEKIWPGEETAKMTVLKDVVISGQTFFDGATIITNKSEQGVTIQTAETWNPSSIGVCLLFTNGQKLILKGASPENGITIDGRKLKTHIRNDATFEAGNVTFKNGMVANGFGGAINAQDGKITIIDHCAFKDNKANTNGGAIYVTNGSLQVTDTEFSGNHAVTGHGGAIFAGINAKVTLTVSNEQATLKNFTGNEADSGSGGAIMANATGASVSINGYTFTGNIAKTMGGAIRFNEGTSFAVTKCSFERNKSDAANSTGGGAIYAVKDLNVTDCDFTANHAQYQGGAIYATTGKLTIQDSVFDSNYAIASHGGAVAMVKANNSSAITNTTFYGNHADAESGGALLLQGSTLNVTSCEFGRQNSPNTAIKNGGAIYVTGANGNLILTVDESVGPYKSFNYNTANSGGAIMVINGKASVDGYTFAHNSATQRGGAIRCNTEAVSLTVGNCNFNNNSTTTDSSGNTIFGGGAICAEQTTTITGSTFEKNSGFDGGTILANATKTGSMVTIKDGCTFTNNTSSHRGAAIYVQAGSQGITVQQSTFKQNFTGGHGGAVFARASLDVSDCEFDSNTASDNYGGAIDQEAGEGTVKTSIFYRNKAKTGGAVASTGGTLTLTNCDFNKTIDGTVVGNTASSAGSVAGATSRGKIMIKIEDGTSRSLAGNTTTKGNLYAQNGASVSYSALYTDVAPGTGGNPVGTVTPIEN